MGLRRGKGVRGNQTQIKKRRHRWVEVGIPSLETFLTRSSIA
jgi:hypothetical protein